MKRATLFVLMTLLPFVLAKGTITMTVAPKSYPYPISSITVKVIDDQGIYMTVYNINKTIGTGTTWSTTLTVDYDPVVAADKGHHDFYVSINDVAFTLDMDRPTGTYHYQNDNILADIRVEFEGVNVIPGVALLATLLGGLLGLRRRKK